MGKSNAAEIKRKKISQLPVIRPACAGIDVSDTEMMLACPDGEGNLEISAFGCFTSDLNDIVDYLKKRKIIDVVMESTGVYWIPLFLLLQEHGFAVCLVNAKHAKNVSGRKDDESDAEWLQKLHSCGLLSESFQPDTMTRTLRCMTRHRKNLVRTAATYINRIQKALEQMNIKLHTVISDIDGKTGCKIIEAILAGERDPAILADLRDGRIKATREDIIKSLEGRWTKEHLFELRQNYKLYSQHRDAIDDCDKEIENALIEQLASRNEGVITEVANIKRKPSTGKNRPKFNLTAYLKDLLGVDVTEITGISELSALAIVSEVGTDMSKWKTENHFTSWMGVAPNTKISGGKVISSRIMKKKSHAGQTFRMAANSLYGSKSPLGDYYRRIRAKAGPAKAVVATARKLAIIYYKMVSNKEAYNPKALEEYQKKTNEKKIAQLKKVLAKLEAA